jgi:non-specific serine/threonine protein kinase
MLLGDAERAIAVSQECRELCAAHGERWYHSHALWVLGLAVWQQGDTRRATELEQDSIRLKRSRYDRLGIAHCVEALAWFAASDDRHPRAALLLGAAQSLRQAIGVSIGGFAHLVGFHERAEAQVRQALGAAKFRKQHNAGRALPMDGALAAALDEPQADQAVETEGNDAGPAVLTRREREVAGLVAAGMTNREIAEKLVVSRRTAESHVEHILVKLGFTSRAQIAAWHTEEPAG